jgi:tetratricopeptide (TPR) repeat protein
MFEAFFGFLAEYTLELGGGAALIAIVETVFKPFRKIFGRTETVKLDDETKAAIAPVQANDITTLTVPEFIRLRRELKADIERDLEAADESEKSTLRAQIADLEAQIANPDEALVVANKRIADLEDILERAGNDIGGDRIIAAKAALEKGDYSIADDIFAEIEAREEMAVQNAARAAFGRGEVAEAQVRWHDAYTHYKRAVHLHETTDHLKSFSMMAWRMGKREEAVAADEKLVSRAKTDFGGGSKEHAVQLNNLGTGVRDQGRYAEAEGLFREALRIDADTIGTAHPYYAKDLNNLGVNMVYHKKKFTEAHDLLKQALVIRKATLPADHPDIAGTEGSIAAIIAATK